MSECSHNCETCGENCPSRQNPADFIEKPHELSSIKKVIGVVSGKGGVGKSLVTSMMSVLMQRRGYQSAILDADVTGPSIPRIFGLKERAMGDDNGIYPVKTKTGIEVMSVNLLLEDDTTPVVWRGPIIAGTVKQFWTDVIWNDVDFMFVDMPPGTGDVPLTVFQSLPVDGIIVVTSPQELDEHPHSGHCGKHELCGLPRLRQGLPDLRRKSCGRGSRQKRPEGFGPPAH